MESFGEIVDLIVLRCKQSQKGKGCGFCTFASRESALKAIDELHGKHIFAEMKNPLQVKFAHAESSIQQQSAKLFVGQLPKSVDEGALSAAFEEYGTIVECQILRRGKDSRGCGFVRLDGRNEAEAAVEGLNGAFVFNGQNSPLNVRFAANSREKQQRRQAKRKEKGIRSQMANMPVMTPYQGSAAYSQEMAMTYPYIQMTAMDQMHNMQMLQYVGMRHLPTAMGMGSSVIPDSGRPRRGPPNSNLFIFNIPPDWNDQILAEVFMPFGKVLSSKVYVDIETRKSKGFGFVSYDSPQAAEFAIKTMNDYTLPGGKLLKVSLKHDTHGSGASSSHLSTKATAVLGDGEAPSESNLHQ